MKPGVAATQAGLGAPYAATLLETAVILVFTSDNNPIYWISVDRLQRQVGPKSVFSLFIHLDPDQSVTLVPEAHTINHINYPTVLS